LVVVVLLGTASTAFAQPPTPYQTITATGAGLDKVFVGNDLGCQVFQNSEEVYGFFTQDALPGDCGTLLAYSNELYGPSFADHQGGTDTPFPGTSGDYTAYTAVSQSSVGGSGTAASPYQVTTTVGAGADATLTEVDSYVAGTPYYATDVTITNDGPSTLNAVLYRAGDCFNTAGYGAVETASGAVACANNSNAAQGGEVEEFDPLTAGSSYDEELYSTFWSSLIDDQAGLPDSCQCTSQEQNGTVAGLSWNFSVPAGGSTTISSVTNFSLSGTLVQFPVVATQPASGVTTTAATLNGTINPVGTVTCEFQWGTTSGYGNTAPCSTPNPSGTSAMPESAALAGLTQGTTYHDRVVATGTTQGTSYGTDQTFTTTTPPPPPGPPAVLAGAVVVNGSTAADLAGSVDPDGQATTAQFEYGLDPKYSGGGPIVYTQTTPDQTVGSDDSDHALSATLTGLVPNALYHVRLVATNASGTVTGPDQTFTTSKAPNPPPPVLGQSGDVTPISGLVLIKPPAGKSIHASGGLHGRVAGVPTVGQGFVPLTQARQVPVGSQIDALRGTLQLVVASARKHKTQQVRLSGGLFTLGQNRRGPLKGLTTFALKESAFAGAPSYSQCSSSAKLARSAGAGGPEAKSAKLKPKVLQTLLASEKSGSFRTKGRYAAATVRGTEWITEDRCDGTLTIVKRGVVAVQDFHTRKTIILHAGQRFLAKP
jgi:hypothetical protein